MGCVQLVVRACCCVMQWALKMYNSYAFVFVGLKGESYCGAAKRTFETLTSKDNALVMVATDEALHDVVRLAKLVSFYFTMLAAFVVGYELDVIGWSDRSWRDTFVGPLLCVFLATVSSYALTLTMGRLLEACVCTLLILYSENSYRACMSQALPHIHSELEAVQERRRGGDAKVETV